MFTYPISPSIEAVLIPGVYQAGTFSHENVFGGCYGCVGSSQQPGFYAGPVVITSVPEPSAYGLTLIGIALTLLVRKKKCLLSKIASKVRNP